MLSTLNSDPGHISAASGQDPAAVHSQLGKILKSPHFRNSKRSQALLRFAVEGALTGDHNSLKERGIGAAVFGRDAAYDTAQDPIVRNAAIEVRKRLAQYYLEPEHTCELRIELPLGSYLPTFTVEAPAAEPAELPTPSPPTPRRHDARRWVIAAVTLALLGTAAAFLWGRQHTPASELQTFWEPLFREHKNIQICIGQPTRLYRFVGPRAEEVNRLLGGTASADRNNTNLSIAAGEVVWVAPEYLFMRDALSAFKVASWIQAGGRAYQLKSVSQTNYSQLRHAPLVAIGAFNNAWSMRVTAELRFVFDHRIIDGVPYNCINDRRNPNAADWKVMQPAGQSITDDYAIVTRVFDPSTENTVISAAGIETSGTLAATEFVTEPEYLSAALRAAPADWRRKNVQFVLGTRIIDGTPGPPRVLNAHFW
jgi:hypothetical protein